MRVKIQSRKLPLVNTLDKLRGFDNGYDSPPPHLVSASLPQVGMKHKPVSVRRDAIVLLGGCPALPPSALLCTD